MALEVLNDIALQMLHVMMLFCSTGYWLTYAFTLLAVLACRLTSPPLNWLIPYTYFAHLRFPTTERSMPTNGGCMYHGHLTSNTNYNHNTPDHNLDHDQ